MPAPEGLSGAPLFDAVTGKLVGIVYGTNDVATLTEFASVDEETGERTPEIQRMVSFGLAHFTPTVAELRGPATGDQPLGALNLAPGG